MTTNEVRAIYQGGGSGKCVSAIPPFITTQPVSQTVMVGSNVTFTVSAGGSPPLSYQWQFNGTNLAGATAASLTLTNVQLNRSGNYSVVVSNRSGTTKSASALLTVLLPSATVLVVSGQAPSGGTVTIPVLLFAIGKENALGFSLNFNTQRLTYASASLAGGAASATLLLNTNHAGAGKLGVALALPANAHLPAGTQEVVRVNFTSPLMLGGSSVVTTITFGDQPILRQLSDAQAQPLAANFLDGSFTLTPTEFEGDLAPRPTGDRTNSITDWVQAGRFAARLDAAAPGSEFRRADCAPREGRGNGRIDVTDWVQAGRYAAALDPQTIAAGPTSPTGAAVAKASQPRPLGLNPARRVRVGNATCVPGLTVTLPVTLESQGDESALGFTLNFDPLKFSYAGTSLGSAASGASFNVNADQVSSGKLGIALMLPLGTSFSSGAREVVNVSLIATAAALGSNPVSFSNSPVSCVISDPLANELTAQYVPGSISVNPPPVLRITMSGEKVTLAWPEWAAPFNLQAAEGTLTGSWTNVTAPPQTNAGNLVVTLPVAGETRYFRLQHP